MAELFANRRCAVRVLAGASIAACLVTQYGFAAERVTLRNGFDMVCDHRAQDGGKTRLFLDSNGANFLDVDTAEIAEVEPVVAAPVAEPVQQAAPAKAGHAVPQELQPAELHQILNEAGAQRDLNVDLLASVVDAESGGHANARSRAGAEGLMQLMPGTAHDLGVTDRLAPRQNVSGGTAYLDALLRRYHDNLALALAAYNAGPAAVDRWHGVPPYRETRAYVARIIHRFNQRYAARQAALRKANIAGGATLARNEKAGGVDDGQ